MRHKPNWKLIYCLLAFMATVLMYRTVCPQIKPVEKLKKAVVIYKFRSQGVTVKDSTMYLDRTLKVVPDRNKKKVALQINKSIEAAKVESTMVVDKKPELKKKSWLKKLLGL